MPIRPLTKQLQEIASKEINEVPERRNEDLKHIEEWLDRQPHLNVRKDKQFLLNFLRSAKFSLQRTKEKLDYFYTVKSVAPELYQNKDPLHPKIQIVLQSNWIVPITKITAQECFPTIFLVKWENAVPSQMTFNNLIKVTFMYMDMLLKEDDNFSICGLYLVLDMKNFSLDYLTYLTPTICQRGTDGFQRTYPIRLKGLYFFNVSKMCEVVVNTAIKWFNKKIMDRIRIFNDQESNKIFEMIPQKYFPREYGGEAGPFNELSGEWSKILVENRSWFLEEESYCSDESKRMENLKASTTFGIDGSFRQLTID